jgi:hypothetical protein
MLWHASRSLVHGGRVETATRQSLCSCNVAAGRLFAVLAAPRMGMGCSAICSKQLFTVKFAAHELSTG